MKRVFVGLSGGVDSSVAAKRLLERGYDVVGVFIKVWQPEFIHCDWEKERLDAMRVATHLGIPFLTMDAEDAYKREVADYLIDSYSNGVTPNPDVMCNEHVKFGAFYEWAKEYGADMIATGHYAQIKNSEEVSTLHTATDSSKDQSYFLSRVRNAVLSQVLFPIGDTVKHSVRLEAQKAGIPTAEKSDSQGICFLGQVNMKDFLSHFISLQSGEVLDEDGNGIGAHDGALLYTVGQRHGFTVTGNERSSSPKYVVARDIRNNTITVGDAPPQMDRDDTIVLTNIRELGTGYKNTMELVYRYHGPRIPVHVEKRSDDSVILHTIEPGMEIPAKGQIGALYSGTECCGGGIIS